MTSPLRKGPSGPTALGAAGNVVSWKLDGSGDAQTWDEVMRIIAASTVPIVIVLEPGSYSIPPGPTYLMKRAILSAPPGGSIAVLTVEDGAVLSDLSGFIGAVETHFKQTGGDSLVFAEPKPGVLLYGLGARLVNDGAVPVLTARPAGGTPDVALSAILNGYIISGASPFAGIEAGGTLFFEVFDGFNLGDPIPSNLFSGPVGAVCLLAHDGTIVWPFPAQPSFLGTLLNAPVGSSMSAGDTSFRPIGLGPLALGTPYFDTTIVPPRTISWDGTQWVDATGAPV